jgi:hypothetical protein
MNTIDKRKEKAEKRAVWLRNYQRARGRALTRLAQQYPDQYKDILEQERLSDEANGKKWSDLSGRTIRLVGSSRAPSRRRRKVSLRYTNRNRKNKGKLGRKRMRTENWQSDTPGLRLVGEGESGSVLSPYGPMRAGLTTSHSNPTSKLSFRYCSTPWREK